MVENEAATAREALEKQYVLGMEDGFQEGYKMRLQDGWSKGLMMGLKKRQDSSLT
jgi:flagellar biosynthesis/type III secretory pathway protein FliH